LVEKGSQFHFDHILFRDFLRTNRQDALAYEALKSFLAKKFPGDREAYTDGKSDFVGEMLSKAKRAFTRV
jgi:GrpB-like predicted nucleotidyltransferase (UPF0157 family)